MARSDTDTWDLATSVGATATMVAAQRALAAAGPHPLIDDPYAAPLVRAVGIDIFNRLLDGEIPVEPDDPVFDPKRMAEGMAVRTRFFDQHFLGAAAAGVRQAVILASGLDSRAYRLAWGTERPRTTVYEVDMPQVIEFKTATLERLGAQPTAERRVVPVDLRDDWPAALRSAGFDPAAPTAWSAEGLLIYLPPAAQDALLDDITALSAPGSHFACEYMPDPTIFNGPAWQQYQQRAESLGMEVDIADLVYPDGRHDVLEYLRGRGWQAQGRTVGELHADNGFDYPDDELAVAFGQMTYVSAKLAG